MNEILNTFIANYGVVVTIIIVALSLIFAMVTILLPLFVWGIHNQTTRTAKELIKLNQLIERLRLQQAPHEGMAKQPLKDSRTEEMVEEIIKKDPQETLIRDQWPEVPTLASKRKKVFIKPEDEVKDRRNKTG